MQRLPAAVSQQPEFTTAASLLVGRRYGPTVSTWALNQSDGELRVHTGVSGRAAKMGHRLTIAVASWRATVSWSGKLPSAVTLTADAASLQVVAGEGGLTPLSAAEKHLATGNALKCLGAKTFPEIQFESENVAKTDDGYRLSGAVEIHGVRRHQIIDVAVADLGGSWCMSAEVAVRQSVFGVKPYSMLMGSMKVTDEVTVSFRATWRKDG